MSQSLGRALDVLVELGEGGRGLDELAGLLGVHKSTVLRLLRTLESRQFVRRDADHTYHLGSRFFALSSRALEQRVVRAVAAPYLSALNRSTGQTVHLAALEGGQAIYIDKYDSRQPVQTYSRVGLAAPLHCAAVGKVLLAGLPERQRREAVASVELVRYTDRTVTSAERLLAVLEEVRADGYAVDHLEHEPFMNCIAAPVRDASGTVAAAVSVSVPELVLDYDGVLALVPELRDTADCISRDCGYDPTAG